MNRRLLISLWGWLLALAAALTGSLALAQEPAPPVPEPGSEEPQDPPAAGALPGTDIVCLLDTSRSVARADPRGDRIAALQVLLSAVARGQGDRVAVARFAGDVATRERSVLLGWTEVPADGFAQAEVFDVIDAALEQAAVAGERAADWNAASDVALQALLDTRGDSAGRPLWILLVTDGELDPIEGDAVPAAYLPADPAALNGNLREYVTAAAEDRFLAGGLQRFVQPGVWVTPLRVGAPGAGRDLCALISTHTGAAVLDLAELGPIGVLERVLAELPARVHPAVHLRVLVDETLTLEPGAATMVALPVPLARRPAVSIIEVPDGAAQVQPALQSGAAGDLKARAVFGGRYRTVAWFDAFGHDTAQITAAQGGTARVVHLALLDYEIGMEFEDAESTPASPGDSIKIAVSLHDRGSAAPIEALTPFNDAHVTVEVIAADGTVAGTASGPIFGEFTVRGVVEVPVPEHVRGACTLRAVVSAIRRTADGEPLFRSEPRELLLPVRAPLLVRFGVPRPLVQQAVAIYGDPDGARPAGDTVTVPISSAGGEPVAVPLAWNAEAKRFEGTWLPSAVGPASLIEGRSGAALVRLAPGAGCEVLPRALDVTPAPRKGEPQSGAPAESEVLSMRRLDDGGYEGRVRVAASLLQGEAGQVVVQALTAAGGPVPGFVVALDAAAAVAIPDNRVNLGPAAQILLVRFTADPGRDAQLRFAGALPGGTITKTLALAVPPSGMLKKVLGIVVSFLLLIAAGLFFQRYTCPQFEDRQLRLHTPGRTAERTRYLREFPRGSWGRVGMGTPEAPRSVEFRLVGLRGVTPVRCRILSRKPYIRIQINGSDLQGARELQDGDQIVLKGATLALRYTYYENEGPAGEQTRMLHRGDVPATQSEIGSSTVAGRLLASTEFVLVDAADLPYLLAGDPDEAAATMAGSVLVSEPAGTVNRATAETGAFAEGDDDAEDAAAETLGEGEQWPTFTPPGEATGGYGADTGHFGDETGHYGDATGGFGDAPPTVLGEETNLTERTDALSQTLGAESSWADAWASQLGEETGAADRDTDADADADADADDIEIDNAQTLDESTQIDTSLLDDDDDDDVDLDGSPGPDEDPDGRDDRDEAAETLSDDNTLATGSIEDDLPDFLR